MSTLHVYSNRHIKDQVVNIKKGDWVYLENSLSKNRWNLYFNYNNIDEKKLKLTYITQDEFFSLNTENGMTKKFDVIVGNPPYQDGSKDHQQNKIYNLISKKALSLLSDKGIITFLTPSNVGKKSKRFSLMGNRNLVSIDFSADNFFNVGVNICSWTIDKTKDSDSCKVISSTGKSKKFNVNDVLFDFGIIDEEVMKIKTNIKEASNDPDKRMFLRNNPGPTSSKTKDNDFKYPLFNFDQKEISCYVKREPYNHGKKKLVISMTKSLNEEMLIVSDKDFNDSHVCIEIENGKQLDNIKSFILSDYFLDFSNTWKQIDGYGFNEGLKYLPPFDKNKKWDNDSVKKFIEGFK